MENDNKNNDYMNYKFTKEQQVNYDRFIDLLAQLMIKHSDSVLKKIEKRRKK